MLKRKHLEMILDSLKRHPNPKIELEQYTIDGKLAGDILYFAINDFYGNVVIDLGCGTGKLAIGSKLLGAKRAIGIDIDKESIKVAKENAKKVNADVEFYCKDIREIDRQFINEKLKEDKYLKKIIIQNPPFGAQKKQADRIFVDKALEIGDVVYTIHNKPTKNFIKNYIESKGGEITHEYEASFKIPATYSFHKKKVVNIPVIIFRIENKSKNKDND
ncbi:methyltransferase small [Methanocaldococcus vulcanius M7]|uniref:Methyltransferase small n=1 Tax=Methanocaldococcus vulcanius (strain ATCC 700851 / DSM 12094 / M7) TaxID=579137 RepID=C9RG24_METVM|nr:METTL5 family protein [Methanocaldococcus vulcanius]ACX72526.1 methyltransferase small [Methanocaldococcus vulcanius M7]